MDLLGLIILALLAFGAGFLLGGSAGFKDGQNYERNKRNERL